MEDKKVQKLITKLVRAMKGMENTYLFSDESMEKSRRVYETKLKGMKSE